MKLPPVTDIEECVFRHIRLPGQATLDGYRSRGGYRLAEAVLLDVRESGLPFEPEAVCRVRDKDRVLMAYDPHAVLDGLALVARELGRGPVLIWDGDLPESPVRIERRRDGDGQDAEMFAAVSHIVRKSAAWYRGLGFGRYSGTKILTFPDRQVEVRMGLPVGALVAKYGGVRGPFTIDGAAVDPAAPLDWPMVRGGGVVAPA